MEMFIPLLIILGLLVLFFTTGHWREKSHLKSLDRREEEHRDMQISNLKAVTSPETVEAADLVMGEAVIATDYFKTFAAGLRNLVGGEVRSYETLMRRARREACLRMLEEARQLGATEVWNVRYETSNILSATNSGTNKSQAASVEAFAFGTAIRRR